MNKNKKTRKIRELKKKTRKIWDTWDWYKYKGDICPYIRPQLGVSSKLIYNHKTTMDINRKKMEKMLLKDIPGIKKLKRGENCTYGYYKIFFYIFKNKKRGDYHFLRQDNTGKWSHKMGQFKVKLVKEKSPELYVKNWKRKYNNKLYKIEICGYYAVPIKGKKNLGSLYFL